MTFNTIRRKVRPGQGEHRRIVVKNIVSIASWVAGQTSRIGIGITAHAIVLIVRFRVGVASNTGKFCVIRRIGMAIHTGIPLSIVFTTINREILGIVVKSGRRPSRFGMASCAIG